jgi:nucleotide-binding universal stress UspA family protein
VDVFGEAYRSMLELVEARATSARARLEKLADRIRGKGIDVETRVVTDDGRIPDLIKKAAVDAGADLLVLASHGRRGIAHALLGSVAERAAHLSRIPVLLLPPPAEGTG